MSKFAGRGSRKAEKLNITSLMDALTIILIFLLVNYSEVTEDSELPNFIDLPTLSGKVDKQTKINILVVIGENKIRIGKDRDINFSNFKQQEESIMERVKKELENAKKEKDLDRKLAETKEGGKKEHLAKISIQADKKVPYYMIDAVVRASSELGMNFFDLITKKKQQ
jgi:biopolymer transport protein ExbD